MKKLIFVVILLMMVGSGTFIFFESDYFKIESIEITGDDTLSDYEIQEYSGIRKTMNLVLVDEKTARDALEEHPMIKSAKVEKSYPNRIMIQYELREPVLAIAYAGNYIIIDEQWHAMKVRPDPGGLLTLYGIEVDNFNLGHRIAMADEDKMTCIVELVKLLELSDLNFIPSVHILGKEVVVRILDDFHVNFGDGHHMEDRFNTFYTIYRELMEEGVSTGVIDVSTDGLPTYRPFGE